MLMATSALAEGVKAVATPTRATPSSAYVFITARFDGAVRRGFTKAPLKERNPFIEFVDADSGKASWEGRPRSGQSRPVRKQFLQGNLEEPVARPQVMRQEQDLSSGHIHSLAGEFKAILCREHQQLFLEIRFKDPFKDQ